MGRTGISLHNYYCIIHLHWRTGSLNCAVTTFSGFPSKVGTPLHKHTHFSAFLHFENSTAWTHTLLWIFRHCGDSSAWRHWTESHTSLLFLALWGLHWTESHTPLVFLALWGLHCIKTHTLLWFSCYCGDSAAQFLTAPLALPGQGSITLQLFGRRFYPERCTISALSNRSLSNSTGLPVHTISKCQIADRRMNCTAGITLYGWFNSGYIQNFPPALTVAGSVMLLVSVLTAAISSDTEDPRSSLLFA